jgi:hypothetical protein
MNDQLCRCRSNQSSYSRIDREQNGPRDAAAHEADEDDELKVAHKEVAVNGLVLEDVFVVNAAKVLNPSKQARAGGWCLAPVVCSVFDGFHPRCGGCIPVAQAVNVRSRRIESLESGTEDQEEGDKNGGDKQIGNQRRHETRGRVGICLVVSGGGSLSCSGR